MSSKISVFTTEYWDGFLGKAFSFLVSIKFIVLVTYATLSAVFLCKGLITGKEWVDVTESMMKVVLVREVIKMKGVAGWIKDTANKLIKKKEDDAE